MKKIGYRRGVIVEEDEPEKDPIRIDRSRMRDVDVNECKIKFGMDTVKFERRGLREFEGKALYLSGVYDWVLCKDSEGAICLIPLEKEVE